MPKKIVTLAFVNGILILTVFFSWWWQDKRKSNQRQEQKLYLIADTAAIVRAVINQTELTRHGKKWLINQKWEASPEKINDWLTVVARCQEKRPVTDAALDSVKRLFQENALEISLYGKEGLLKKCTLATSEDETYGIAENNKPVVIYVPQYLGSIFPFFRADASWREKRILNTSWKTLKSFRLEYLSQPTENVQIVFDSTFYVVYRVKQLDTVRLFQYIDKIARLKVKEFFPKETIETLVKSLKPDCQIYLQDLDKQKDNQLIIYRTDSLFYGIQQKSDEAVSIDKKSLQPLLVTPSYFEQKKLPF
ncbi:MAG: hypothetical protein NZ521_05830 [Flammeovirgaceae bacterium]|nr:hypothetical protein [Flammeovirgaceae bacterium]MDW8287754.1 hypothetical protein [Flammeovirgaceae bacterium]